MRLAFSSFIAIAISWFALRFVPRNKFSFLLGSRIRRDDVRCPPWLRSERQQFGGRGGRGGVDGEYRDIRKRMKKRLTKSAAAIAVYRDTLTRSYRSRETRDRKNCDCIFGMNHIHLLGSCSLASDAETHAIVHARIASAQLASPRNRARGARTSIGERSSDSYVLRKQNFYLILESRRIPVAFLS